MSPLVWDLAHVANYEELWLLRALDGRPARDEQLDWLYNAFEHPRWTRPSLPLLDPTEARAYAASVRHDALALLTSLSDRLDAPADPGTTTVDRLLTDGFVYGMVLQHEHQHAETILATRQLMGPAAAPPPGATLTTGHAERPDLPADVAVAEGDYLIGTDDDPWAYDNERSRHQVHLEAFRIDTVPVTVSAFRQFVDDGGYHRPELWAEDGFAWARAESLEHPQFWQRAGEGSWALLRGGRVLDLDDLADEPVQHVSWHEAQAFATWAGRRLPTEAEWEVAATWDPATGRPRRFPWGDDAADDRRATLGQRFDGPRPVGAVAAGVSPLGMHQAVGDVWEWTASRFDPHPGFESFPYDEYSAVFFAEDHRVLKGGSWATDPLAVRGTFRNWDHPIRRQIFAGFRTAADDR
jgi:iron(II)-dependent oxidoreductase